MYYLQRLGGLTSELNKLRDVYVELKNLKAYSELNQTGAKQIHYK